MEKERKPFKWKKALILWVLLGLVGLWLWVIVGMFRDNRWFTETYYLGATVVRVEHRQDSHTRTLPKHEWWANGGPNKTEYTDVCRVVIAYEDGYVKPIEVETSADVCYRLQEGDWVDGWMEEDLVEYLPTGEIEVEEAYRHVDIWAEFDKRAPQS